MNTVFFGRTARWRVSVADNDVSTHTPDVDQLSDITDVAKYRNIVIHARRTLGAPGMPSLKIAGYCR